MTSRSKDHKMHRRTADRMKDGLLERIKEINDDPYMPLYVDRAVIFGSYANHPERDMLSDLDVGLSVLIRYGHCRQIHDKMKAKMYEKVCNLNPSYNQYDSYTAIRRYLIVYLRDGSHYISIHPIEGDDAIFSEKWVELDVGPVRRLIEVE